MQSHCLGESTEPCLNGCCSYPLFSLPQEQHQQDPLNKLSSTSSAACRRNFATIASSFFPNTQFTHHESLPSLEQSFDHFTKAFPRYSETRRVDRIRAREYDHLSISNHICLDYIGIGLFSHSQLQSQFSSSMAVSPSSSPPSQYSGFPFFSVCCKPVSLKSELLQGTNGSELESAVKRRIFEFLNINENEYGMVFTANRSSAFKILAESYPFQSSRKLLTVYDCESEAVEAMIDESRKRGARVMSAEFSWPRLRIQSAKLKKMVAGKYWERLKKRGLFVFPLQSRMSGASYSYQWMSTAQENGWHVLLDACALGPKDMDSFGLSLFRPDFLICSFYKVFGENPTGFACLFVKRSIVSSLEASSSSGIVSIVPAKKPQQSPETDDSSATDIDQLEQIELAVFDQAGESSEAERSPENRNEEIECRGLDHVDSLGLMMISSRGRYLTNWLVNALMKLHHPNTENKSPLVRIYGPKIKFNRGPALAFNVYDLKGDKIEPALVQKLADGSNISVSQGFLHNIWFSDKYQEERDRVMERRSEMEEKEMVENKRKGRDGDGVAVVTAALGFLASFEDVYGLWTFVARFLDADFVEKERWRYTALNQKTIEI